MNEFVICNISTRHNMCALECADLGQFTTEEIGILGALWPGGVRIKLSDRDIYEVWCTGFGPAMTFTKNVDGEIVVTDLTGMFMTSGTSMRQVVYTVGSMLNLEID